jgi:acyl-CoA thioester hydrolase
MAHVQRSSFSVRSYELDSYAHLNNGVYLSWFEQSRLEYLQHFGFSYDGFAERKQWMVVARTEVDFRKALLQGEAVVVETRIVAFGRSSVRFNQRMLRAGGDLACEALTVMVFSGVGGGSIPIPEDVLAAIGPLDPADGAAPA